MNNELAPGTDTGALQLQTIRWMLHATYRVSRPAAGRLCYRVLSRPPRKAPTDEEALFLAAAEQRTMVLNKMHIQVYHWPGKGPKVLLAHGWNSQSARWQIFGTQLQELGYDVYALDAPAHGQSTGRSFALPFYAEAMNELVLSIQPQAIIGHSAGGMASIYFMHRYQQTPRPERLALIATPAELTHFMDSFQRILGLKAGVMQELEREFSRRFKRSFSYFSTAAFLEQLDRPGLIIHDEQDDVAPVQGAHRMAKIWTESELMLTQGLGHSVQHERVRERLLNWLES